MQGTERAVSKPFDVCTVHKYVEPPVDRVARQISLFREVRMQLRSVLIEEVNSKAWM